MSPQRMIVVSIIGIDRFTAGYYPAKVAHETGSNTLTKQEKIAESLAEV